LLSSNISSTCPHNMVNFGPLAAEIVSLVWGTPGNFNVFRVLAALLHGTLVVGASQIAVLNRGRHQYSAWRPSRWALAHILVNMFFSIVDICLSCGRYSPTKLCDGTQMAIFWRFLRRTFSVSRAQPIFRPEARVYRQHCAQRKSAGI